MADKPSSLKDDIFTFLIWAFAIAVAGWAVMTAFGERLAQTYGSVKDRDVALAEAEAAEAEAKNDPSQADINAACDEIAEAAREEAGIWWPDRAAEKARAACLEEHSF